MTCPRCQGLIIAAWEDVRCVNCGWRQTAQPAPPSIETIQRLEDQMRCKHSSRCMRRSVEGQTLCETHRMQRLAYMNDRPARLQIAAGHGAEVIAQLDAKITKLMEQKRRLLGLLRGAKT